MKILETKIPPPIVAAVFAALIWWVAGYLPKTYFGITSKTIVVTVLLALGILFDLSGLTRFLGARTTINPIKPHNASALVQSGIYKFTRNPMYVGLVFLLTAWCIYLDCPVALVAVAGFMLYIHVFQILPEERTLAKLFGEEYHEYQARVRRWL